MCKEQPATQGKITKGFQNVQTVPNPHQLLFAKLLGTLSWNPEDFHNVSDFSANCLCLLCDE